MTKRRRGRSLAYRTASARPRRVLPLAIGAIIGTLSVAAAANQASRELSHGRYAEEILREAVAKSPIKLPKIRTHG